MVKQGREAFGTNSSPRGLFRIFRTRPEPFRCPEGSPLEASVQQIEPHWTTVRFVSILGSLQVNRDCTMNGPAEGSRMDALRSCHWEAACRATLCPHILSPLHTNKCISWSFNWPQGIFVLGLCASVAWRPLEVSNASLSITRPLYDLQRNPHRVHA